MKNKKLDKIKLVKKLLNTLGLNAAYRDCNETNYKQYGKIGLIEFAKEIFTIDLEEKKIYKNLAKYNICNKIEEIFLSENIIMSALVEKTANNSKLFFENYLNKIN